MGKHSAATSSSSAPTSSAGSSSTSTGHTRSTSSSSRHAATGQTARDARQVADAATTINAATARSNRGGKPSTTRKAVGGAAAGAATGAAVGSVVPGVGTAIGAGAGAVIGGAGGAWKGHSDKKAWKAAGKSGSNRVLLAEFLLCLVIVALSPSVKERGEVTPGAWMKRGSAVCVLFILLGMLAAVGPRTSRVAGAFGGLVTLGLVVSEREVIGKLLQKFGPGQAAGVDLTGDGGADGGTAGRPAPDAPTDPDDRTGRRPPPDGPTRPARYA